MATKLGQNGLYFCLRTKFLRNFSAYEKIWGIIFSRPIPVAMGTKFKTKLGITRLA